jgi:hypothetical protein
MVGIKAVFAFSLDGTAFCALSTLAVPFKKIPRDPSQQKTEEVEATS